MEPTKLIDNISKLINSLKSVSEIQSEELHGLGIRIARGLNSGGAIFWCGNGGSAAESQHMAAELMGRFLINRKPYRSLSLTTDTSAITGISNDFHFNEVFSRHLEGIARPGDFLVVFTTS